MTNTKTFVVTIESDDDAMGQLDQCLAEELKGEFIKDYKIIDLEKHLDEMKQEHIEYITDRINVYNMGVGLEDEGVEMTNEQKINYFLDDDGVEWNEQENTIYEQGMRGAIQSLINQ